MASNIPFLAPGEGLVTLLKKCQLRAKGKDLMVSLTAIVQLQNIEQTKHCCLTWEWLYFFGPLSWCDLSFCYLKRAGYDTQIRQQVNGGQRNASRICALIVIVAVSLRHLSYGSDNPNVGIAGLNRSANDVVGNRCWFKVLTC